MYTKINQEFYERKTQVNKRLKPIPPADMVCEGNFDCVFMRKKPPAYTGGYFFGVYRYAVYNFVYYPKALRL